MNSVIKDVAFRTNGELYIGVVGPVRSGKSMFIRKFMETKVIPFIGDEYKDKVIDELPQSGDGKQIMTVEPKFVPSNNVYVNIDEDINFFVRLVDCVGYVIPSSKGYVNEDDSPRLVKTPWFGESVPFEEAAAIGTKKVIDNHSHLGIIMTSDGSFGEFTRSEYQEIEEKLVNEMHDLEKPFVVVLNTKLPNDEKTIKLINDLETKYDVSVVAVDVSDLTSDDIDQILTLALNEFDINKLDIKVPSWISKLNDQNAIKKTFDDVIEQTTGEFRKFKHVQKIKENLSQCDLFETVNIVNIDSASGNVEIEIKCADSLYDKVLYDVVGDALNDKGQFIELLQEAINAKEEYEQYKQAIAQAKLTGYGIATPNIADMSLETPEVIKQAGRYGVKLQAIAPSIHMIKVDVSSSFEPIIGTEEQSKNLIDQLMANCQDDASSIWNSEIFGRKLSEVVNDGIRAKLFMLSEETQLKFKESLEKVVNKGKGGIIAFIL